MLHQQMTIDQWEDFFEGRTSEDQDGSESEDSDSSQGPDLSADDLAEIEQFAQQMDTRAWTSSVRTSRQTERSPSDPQLDTRSRTRSFRTSHQSEGSPSDPNDSDSSSSDNNSEGQDDDST